VNDELLSAGAAARRLGVAVTTLRSWHQRYGLGPSAHQHGHHRRYTADDMARLILMQQLVTAGVAPAEAARWARRSPLSPPSSTSPSSSASPASPASSSAEPVSPPEPFGARDGGGHALALGDAGPAARGLGRAALRLDTLGIRDLIADEIDERGVIGAWDDVLRPVLVAVGERAAESTELVEVEHILSGCISAVFATLPRPPRQTPVRLLLACTDEEQHSLPIEALAAALSSMYDIPARVLGARVPPSALRAAVRRTGPVAVLLWSHARATANLRQLEETLAGRGRPAVVAAAGPGWDRDDFPPGVAVPTSLSEAVDLLSAAAR
jgi:MerR family transcriptional regulator, light-induced transcriptional regulator